jgi:hypothetical protein
VAALMLLSALYFSFDMTVEQTQVARDKAATEDLMRGVVNRLSVDINAVLGPQPAQSGGTAGMQLPYQLQSAMSGTTSTGGSGATVTGATVTGAMTTGMSGATTPASSSSSSSTNTPLLGSGLVIPLQSGVIGGYEGNNNMLVLFTSRVPDFLTSGPNSLAQIYNSQGNTSSNNNQQVPADLRRVVYWLGNDGGLYRNETPWVTGVDSWNLSDLPLQDNQGVQLAEEVKELTFEYFDPYSQSWETTWDGTGGTSPPYSMQPGPPSAIRITMTFELGNPKGGPPIRSTIAHVFPIATAPGQTTMSLYNPTANGSTSSGGNSNVVGAKTVGAKTVGAKVVGASTVPGK